MHFKFFGLFSLTYTLLITLLTLWGAPPKMFYNREEKSLRHVTMVAKLLDDN